MYHDKTQEIVKQVLATTPRANVRVVLWGYRSNPNILTESTLEDLQRMNGQREGWGGESPFLIAHALKTEVQHGVKLVMISDGQVTQNQVVKANTEMDKIPAGVLGEAEIHLIGGACNMSVSCAFTRNVPSKVFSYNDGGKVQESESVVVSAEDMALLNDLSLLRRLQDVEEKLPAIERAVAARVMGTSGDRNLADGLVEMRKRVVAELSKAKSKLPSAEQLTKSVREGDVESGLLALQRVNDDFFSEHGIDDLESRISKLVSACEGALRTVFTTHGVRGFKLDRASTQTEVEPDSVEITTADATFECPLTLDDETDVVLMFAASTEPGQDLLSASVRRAGRANLHISAP
jgi:hypothetical protein